MSRVVYVGMDVDKAKIVMARLDDGSGREVEERVIANKPSAVKKYFGALVGEGDVMATYEASCFGYGIYRQLTEMGVTCLVAAPGLIPRKPSDRVKTDRRDAKTLALTLRAGQGLPADVRRPAQAIFERPSSGRCTFSFAEESATRRAATGHYDTNSG